MTPCQCTRFGVKDSHNFLISSDFSWRFFSMIALLVSMKRPDRFKQIDYTIVSLLFPAFPAVLVRLIPIVV